MSSKLNKLSGGSIYNHLIDPLGFSAIQYKDRADQGLSASRKRSNPLQVILHKRDPGGNNRSMLAPLAHQEYIHPDNLGEITGKELNNFLKEISKIYRKRSKTTKRVQFDPRKNIRTVIGAGYTLLGIVNRVTDIGSNGKEFTLLFRQKTVDLPKVKTNTGPRKILAYRDNFLQKGGSLELFTGSWDAIDITAESESRLKSWYEITHTKKNQEIMKDVLKTVIKLAGRV